jgi:hypothetical protein
MRRIHPILTAGFQKKEHPSSVIEIIGLEKVLFYNLIWIKVYLRVGSVMGAGLSFFVARKIGGGLFWGFELVSYAAGVAPTTRYGHSCPQRLNGDLGL